MWLDCNTLLKGGITMSLRQNQAFRRLVMVGLTNGQAIAIQSVVNRWVDNNGPEWTVDRLKQLKLWLLHRAAGVDKPAPPWFAHASGKAKGPFRVLFDRVDAKALSRALNAVMCYSAFVSNVVTPKQWKKFQSSVESPTPLTREIPIWNMVKSCLRTRPIAVPWGRVQQSGTFVPVRRMCSFETRSVPETELSEWFHHHASEPLVVTKMLQNPELFAEDLLALVGAYCNNMRHDGISAIGKISFIQETGFKLRAVANPNRVLQHLLLPLKKVVTNALNRKTRDYTRDQEAGITVVQKWLKAGLTVHSVDLSDATNNFPLSLQVRTLHRLLGNAWKAHIDLFEECSKGSWSVKDPISGYWRAMRWEKGQPLGLGPSFVSFAYAHHLLVEWCGRGLPASEKRYAILGDDIAIASDTLYHRYIAALDHLGIPISRDKTLSSPHLAEFAGKAITPEKVIVAPKWRLCSDHNFLDIARLYGPRSKTLLRRRQRAVIDLIALLPEWEGGLGWNPRGLPFEKRLAITAPVRRCLESEDQGSTLGLCRRVLTKLTYERKPLLSLSAYEDRSAHAPTRASRSLLGRVITTLSLEGVVLPPNWVGNWLPGYRYRNGGETDNRSPLEILEGKLRPLL